MFNFLKEYYGINYTSSLKVSDKTYKVLSSHGYYLVKEIKDKTSENIFKRLYLSKVDYILLPLKGKNDFFIQFEDEKYYLVFNYYEDESLAGYDLKLNLHILFLIDLHKKTKINIQINNSYLKDTIDFLDLKIKKASDNINARMEVIERSDYHSPNDWYFLMHYNILNKSLEKASKHLMFFENEVKKLSSIRLCLTYQNFDFNHILLKKEKIISLEKSGYNFISYDLYDLVTKLSDNFISIDTFILDYLKANPLEEYEKEHLMTMLYLFNYTRYENMLDDLSYLISLNDYLSIVDKIEDEIIFSSENEE